MKTKNGFTRPYSRLQILSWVFAFINICMTYSMIYPALNFPMFIPSLITGTLMTAVVLYTGYRATVLDPTDPVAAKS